MRFQDAMNELQMEIVPPEVEASGIRIFTATGKELKYTELDKTHGDKSSEIKAAVKEVYNYINKKMGALANFRNNKIPEIDAIFKADGTVVLTPETAITINGKSYNRFNYKLSNTSIGKILNEV